MKIRTHLINRNRSRCEGFGLKSGGLRPGNGRIRAFTLIEIMVVVAIIGIVAAAGIPSFYRIWHVGGMPKAMEDVVQACGTARARAILSGKPTELVFHPLERRFEVSGGGGVPAPPASGSSASGQLDDDISIEMLDINLLEYKESEVARVRFFPNGTSDEMTVILRSGKNEWRKISLEITTAIATPGPVEP